MEPYALYLIALSLSSTSASALDSKSQEIVTAKTVFSQTISDDAKVYDGSILRPASDKLAASAQVEKPATNTAANKD